MEEISIHTETINLDQLLKWAGLTDTGAEAKRLIEDGLILVNNETVSARRKKIYVGDIVEVKGSGFWKVVGS